MAANGGGCARQAPQTAPPGDGSAQPGTRRQARQRCRAGRADQRVGAPARRTARSAAAAARAQRAPQRAPRRGTRRRRARTRCQMFAARGFDNARASLDTARAEFSRRASPCAPFIATGSPAHAIDRTNDHQRAAPRRHRATRARHRRRAGPSPRSRRCSRCRSPISCSARSRCTARTTRPTPCSCRRCCRSRPAAAPRTAATARRRRATTPASTNEALLDLDAVVAAARAAKAQGATRFCMGAAWRGPKERDLEPVLDDGARGEGARARDLLHARHAEGRPGRAAARRRASTTTTTTSTPRPSSTARSITTRDYQDRLDTLERVRDAGINVCCGGIVGMGESRRAARRR